MLKSPVIMNSCGVVAAEDITVLNSSRKTLMGVFVLFQFNSYFQGQRGQNATFQLNASARLSRKRNYRSDGVSNQEV